MIQKTMISEIHTGMDASINTNKLRELLTEDNPDSTKSLKLIKRLLNLLGAIRVIILVDFLIKTGSCAEYTIRTNIVTKKPINTSNPQVKYCCANPFNKVCAFNPITINKNPIRTIASSILSTKIVTNTVALLMLCLLPKKYARTNSPIRIGNMLLTI